LAKRYADLADALDEMADHLRVTERGSLARDYEIAASGLRTVESIPMNPAELECVSNEVRDAVAEWRAYGKIETLNKFRKERPYLKKLTRVKSIGPNRAEKIHKETGAKTLDDLEELLESGEIEEVHGIGSKTATTFRRSIAQLDRK